MGIKQRFMWMSMAIILLMVLYLKQRKQLKNLIDPLKNSGLNDEEIRLCRYLLSLQDISGITKNVDKITDAESAREFNRLFGARKCQVCERIFSDFSASCPYYHGATVAIETAELMEHINEWETLRRDYCNHINLKSMTHLSAMKLSYLIKHPMER